MTLNIVRRPAAVECAAILAELPEWFGLPDSNAAYAEAAGREEAWLAQEGGDVMGLMVLVDTGFAALDVHLLAVRPNAHRRGVGRTLIGRALAVARELGKTYLTVKTQGPSADYEPYRRTRAFYDAVGFKPLEEFTEIWGPENPCLIMIMPAAGAHGDGDRAAP
jgi:GNAT superfamily N-acetyltransferase